MGSSQFSGSTLALSRVAVDPGARQLGTSLRRTVQRALRGVGVDLHRYPPREDRRLAAFLRDEGIDLVLDVGANAGQYAQRLRQIGYQGRIESFEPLSDAYARVQLCAATDANWRAHHLALGDRDGTAEINVSANSWSSSLLQVNLRHTRSAPDSVYIGTESVSVAQLDSIWDTHVPERVRVFLKLDVQGFEMHVLRGAVRHLSQIAGIQAELSFVELYDGDAPWLDVASYLDAQGFTLVALEPGFFDHESGHLLQADAIFLRRGPA
jgi:FkbM family methyltransferase